MAENIMLNLGIGIDGDQAEIDAKEVYDELSDVLGKTLEINIDTTDLNSLADAIKKANGQISVVRDNLTGFATALNATWEDANGQLIKYSQNLNAIKINGTENYEYKVGSSNYTIQNSGTYKEDLSYIKEYYDVLAKLQGIEPEKNSLWAQVLNTELKRLEPEIKRIEEELNNIGTVDSAKVQDLFNAIDEGQRKVNESQAKFSDKATFESYRNSIKDVNSAINELYSAQNKLINSNASPESNTYKVLKENVESARQTLNQALISLQNFKQAQSFSVNDSVVNGIHTITAEYQGQDEELTKIIEHLRQKNQIQNLSVAKSSDISTDKEKIEEAVAALKELNNAKIEYEKSRLSGASVDDLNKQSAKIKELEQTLKNLISVQLSSNKTVEQDSEYRSRQSTEYGNLNQKLKELRTEYNSTQNSLTKLDNSAASNLANTLQLALSYQTLERAMTEVISTAKELDAAMTDIQIVTQMSDSEAKTLMESYSNIAKELGTTTLAVASSSSEWLFIRSL